MSQYSEIYPDCQENNQFGPILPMRVGDIGNAFLIVWVSGKSNIISRCFLVVMHVFGYKIFVQVTDFNVNPFSLNMPTFPLR